MDQQNELHTTMSRMDINSEDEGESQTVLTIEAMMQQEQNYSFLDCCIVHKGARNCHSFEEDRKLMIKWCYNVIDFFDLGRETVAIAMSYSDRFLDSGQGFVFLQDTKKYQLLCIVSLYLAVKLHESSSLTPKSFVDISRGQYSVNQIEIMERLLLSTLEWRVNPPTISSFVRDYLELIPSSILDRGMRATAYTLARAQTERAMADYQLLASAEPSKIAFACLYNALEALRISERPNGYDWVVPFATVVSPEFLQDHLEAVRIRLCSAIAWETSRIQQHMGGGGSSSSAAATTKRSTSARALLEKVLTNSRSASPTDGAPFRRRLTPRSVVYHHDLSN